MSGVPLEGCITPLQSITQAELFDTQTETLDGQHTHLHMKYDHENMAQKTI